ncbi:MAG: hypothetical protein ARM1_0442 [Candidatus Micrarchaeota archaeon]|nr:MAG: hypothetical protein ARM1_0442 [Candidatus Micrarchaeota archaeon]
MEKSDELIERLNKISYSDDRLNHNEGFNPYIEENGVKFIIPYKIITEVKFKVKKEDLIDIPHSARLQYRLMLLDAVIRATVDFTRERITIVYNDVNNFNNKPKLSIDEIVEFLNVNGVHVSRDDIIERRDYDYYKEFYSYTYNPKVIRKAAPYGISQEEWDRIAPEYERMIKEAERKKIDSFKAWQRQYELEHRDVFGVTDNLSEDKGVLQRFKRLFIKKEDSNKGYWFHGL